MFLSPILRVYHRLSLQPQVLTLQRQGRGLRKEVAMQQRSKPSTAIMGIQQKRSETHSSRNSSVTVLFVSGGKCQQKVLRAARGHLCGTEGVRRVNQWLLLLDVICQHCLLFKADVQITLINDQYVSYHYRTRMGMKGLSCLFSCLQPAQYLNSPQGWPYHRVNLVTLRSQRAVWHWPRHSPIFLNDHSNGECQAKPGYNCQTGKQL